MILILTDKDWEDFTKKFSHLKFLNTTLDLLPNPVYKSYMVVKIQKKNIKELGQYDKLTTVNKQFTDAVKFQNLTHHEILHLS